jgi:catechol 2,3-dioxygenase-like lactoylglutathione lyase family enzyme
MEQVQRLTFFLDLTPGDHAAALAFWRAATGYELSPPRGEEGEFASLLPPAGDEHLKVQRLAEGTSGTHVDVHVADLAPAVEHALDCGAVLVAQPGHAVLRSPGGYLFCLVTAPATAPSAPTSWPDGHRSRVDQLCLDIAPSVYDAECRFWAALTGWPTNHTPGSEFTRLQVPAELGTRVLLQRLEQDEGPVRGHLDLATDDRPVEVRRLVALGAVPIGEGPRWTVLRPPAGPPLCVTGRDPVTGRVG